MFLLNNFSTVMVSYSTNMVVNAIINLKASFLNKNLPGLKKEPYLKIYVNKSIFKRILKEQFLRRFVVKRYVFCKEFSFRVLTYLGTYLNAFHKTVFQNSSIPQIHKQYLFLVKNFDYNIFSQIFFSKIITLI